MRGYIAIAVLLFATACATFDIDESHFFYPGAAATRAPGTVEDVTLTAADGTALGGVYVRQPDADLEVLYFGGNASRADDMAAALGHIVRGLRANVMMIDYRGYGRSAGTPAIATMKSDALAAFDQLRTRAGGRPIVVHGVSLGGFVASHVAANRTVQGLVLEATAPDVATWAKNQIPAYAKPVVRLKIAPALLAESNVEAVRRHSGPLLLVTGSKDAVTPPRFMQPLLARRRPRRSAPSWPREPITARRWPCGRRIRRTPSFSMSCGVSTFREQPRQPPQPHQLHTKVRRRSRAQGSCRGHGMLPCDMPRAKPSKLGNNDPCGFRGGTRGSETPISVLRST